MHLLPFASQALLHSTDEEDENREGILQQLYEYESQLNQEEFIERVSKSGEIFFQEDEIRQRVQHFLDEDYLRSKGYM